MTGTRLRLAEWAEKGMPGLTRALATPAVRGVVSTASPRGDEYRAPGDATSLVVYFTGSPATARWLAGSLAVQLGCVVVVPARGADRASVLRDVADTHGVDPARVAVVAEGDAASAAIEACAGLRVSRLALLYPTGVDVDGPPSAPTTLLQAARHGPHRESVVALDRMLRQAGVAVRETEYEAVPDGWARHPKLVSGAQRALGDLVAFLERGFGTQSTFEVIPGWDLH
jgi:hypothetical protein